MLLSCTYNCLLSRYCIASLNLLSSLRLHFDKFVFVCLFWTHYVLFVLNTTRLPVLWHPTYLLRLMNNLFAIKRTSFHLCVAFGLFFSRCLYYGASLLPFQSLCFSFFLLRWVHMHFLFICFLFSLPFTLSGLCYACRWPRIQLACFHRYMTRKSTGMCVCSSLVYDIIVGQAMTAQFCILTLWLSVKRFISYPAMFHYTVACHASCAAVWFY